MGHGAFEQIAAVLAVTVAAGLLATLLRQPLIVGFLAAGLAVGPSLLGWVEPSDNIDLLATVGVSLLLFVVGLKLDVRLLRRLGSVAAATGLGQVAFTSVIGYALSRALGFERLPALYLALALTFSSTIIVVKLLADKRELNHLHGRIAVGFLLVQDLVAILALLVVTAAGEIGDVTGAGQFGQTLAVIGRAFGLALLAALMGTVLAPRLTRVFDRQGELLVLAVLTWAVLLAAISVSLGFSEEIGAFLAGVSLASTPYRDAVAGRLATLRDFLLVFFFIELGTRFELASALAQLRPAIILSLFVVIGNPLVVMLIMGTLGYRRQVSFRAGLTVAQISEFSFILVALGVQQGHIDNDVLVLVTLVGLVTIAVSSELINNADRLFARLSWTLKIFERKHPPAVSDVDDLRPRPEYVVVGVGRLGATLLQELLDAEDRALGVDFDPRGVKRARWRLPVIYGDADDPGLPGQLPLDDTRWVISTLRDRGTNENLISALRAHGYRGSVAVAADNPDACAALLTAGAHVTIRPLHLAAAPLMRAIHAYDRDSDETIRRQTGAPGVDESAP